MQYEVEYRPMKGYLPSRRLFLGTSAAAAAGFFFSSRSQSEPVRANDFEPTEVPIAQFSAAGRRESVVTMQTIVKADAEWKKQLTPEAYDVTRHAGTERPHTGKYWNNEEKGLYRCVCCGTANFSSDTKFDSGTGWPSFWKPIARENVREKSDGSLGMERIAVSCTRCNAHLGHVFEDGPQPTGRRYCMNSVALAFTKTAV